MKKKFSLFSIASLFFLLTFPSCIFSGSKGNPFQVKLVPLKSPDEELIIAEANKKSGFVNIEGQWVIAPQYDFVYGFEDGVALVDIEGKQFLIDKTNKRLPVPKEAVTISNFICGLASFTNAENKTGYFNREGKIVVPAEYDELALPWDGMRILAKNELYTYVDSLGKIIGEPRFEEVTDFCEGFAAVKQNGLYGYINKKGEWVIKPDFSYASQFREGLAQIGTGDPLKMKYLFIDKTGATVFEVPEQFSVTNEFLNGLTFFNTEKDGLKKFGFMDHKGNVVIEPVYDWVEVRNDEGLPDTRNGFQYFVIRIGDLHGLIYKDIRIEPAFTNISNIQDGLAAASLKENGKTKFGFIDKTGKWIIKPAFVDARNFHFGLAAISDGPDSWGYIDKTGKIIITPQFLYPARFGVNFATVVSNGSVYLIDHTGKKL